MTGLSCRWMPNLLEYMSTQNGKDIMKETCSVLIALLAVALLADDREDVIAAISSNSVDRTVRSRLFQSYYIDQCSKEELDALLERNFTLHRRLIELYPGDPWPHSDFGKSLTAVGRWEDAEKELSIAIAAGDKLDIPRQVESRWEMAGCLWRKGDKDGAKRLIREIPEIEWKWGLRDCYNKTQYMKTMFADPDGDIDTLRLPHSEDGKPFPTPQEATYGEKRVSLAKVEVVFETSPEDPIVRLLKRKLSRFGSEFASGGTKIEIAISPDAPVDKPQGYWLEVRRNREEGGSEKRECECGVISIKARTRIGATWGVVSFLQCINRGALDVRECTIRDWPTCERRGTLFYWLPDYLEYALFNKIASVKIAMDFTSHLDKCFSISPIDRERYRIYIKRFNDFGIETCVDGAHLLVRPLLPLSSPRTKKLHLSWKKFLASIGTGFAFELDDDRFPMHPLDVESAGTAANLDAKYATWLYRTVKKEYPGFRMEFCPPFYWGPDGRVSYPEPREPYLRSLKEHLDQEIPVHWTGSYVKAHPITAEHAKWMADLIGRKPLLTPNGNFIGQHNYMLYGADLSAFKTANTPEIFDLVSGWKQNMSRYPESVMVGACMDFCWNPVAHDAGTAARRTIEQLEGPGVFEILAEATPSISYFDKYFFGELRCEVLTEDQDNLDRRVAAAEKAWAKVISIAKNKGRFVGDFNDRALKYAKRIADARRNPPERLLRERDAVLANVKYAISEAGYDEKRGDEFIPAAMMSGGRYVPDRYTYTGGTTRPVKYVDAELSGSFRCEPFPPQAPFTMVVVAQSLKHEPPDVEIAVNGRVLWRGRPFVAFHMLPPLEIEIPVTALQRSNTFTIRNTSGEPDPDRLPMVNYVVIRKPN